ncbi:MAG: pseudouridine synthase [Pseudomonadota bacterium]
MPLVLLNKPFRVMCQFTDDRDRATLRDFVSQRQVYPAGRLDFDSEGLLALTDDGRLQARIAHPRRRLKKTYWAQVEGDPTQDQLASLRQGVALKDGPARAVSARRIDEPSALWPRTPPIRERKSVPDAWIEVVLDQGRNRQVRRMTAAVGLPTLRLIRAAIGPFGLDGLAPGQTRVLSNAEAWRTLDKR